jgi:hypothetical protein
LNAELSLANFVDQTRSEIQLYGLYVKELIYFSPVFFACYISFTQLRLMVLMKPARQALQAFYNYDNQNGTILYYAG